MSTSFSYHTLQQYQPSGKLTALVDTILKPLQHEHKYYELQQQYKLQATRQLNKHNIQDALYLYYSGCQLLQQLQQYTAASELSTIYVSTLQRYITSINTDVLNDVVGLLLHHTPSDTVQITTNIAYSKAVLKWLTEYNSTDNSNEHSVKLQNAMHLALATAYTQLHQYKLANTHYVLCASDSNTVQQHVQLFEQWVQQADQRTENQYYLCRAVLQYLAAGKLTPAALLLQQFQREISYTDDKPLTHFATFLLQLVQCDHYKSNSLGITTLEQKQQLFEVVQHRYKPLLDADKSFAQYLSKIGEVYFQIKSAQENMLESMFGSIK